MSQKLRMAAEAATHLLQRIAHPEADRLIKPIIDDLHNGILDDIVQEGAGIDSSIAKLDALAAEARKLQSDGPALPLRAMAAISALQGMLANMALTKTVDDRVSNPAEFNAYFVGCAVQMADALLARLAAPEGK